MSVTHILSQIESGDPAAAEQLLPLVYEELRRLAAVRLAAEPSANTLQPTALVHEAYLRLIGTPSGDLQAGLFGRNEPGSFVRFGHKAATPLQGVLRRT